RADILEIHRYPVDDFDREVIHLLDQRDDAVAVDVVVEVTDLDIPRRYQEVLGVDRLDDLVRADSARQHLLPIEKDRNLPHRAAERGWKRNALDRAQLRTDREIGEVADLLLAEGRAVQGQICDRQILRPE